MNKYQENAYCVLYAKTNNLRELAKLSGYDPESFFEFSDLSNIDLRGQDLRGLSFFGANLNGIVIDDTTKIDGSQRRLFDDLSTRTYWTPAITDTSVISASDMTEWKQEVEVLEIQMMDLDSARIDAEQQAEHLARMAEMLNLEKGRAELARRTTSQLLANVSHELRTPLNAMMGFSEILKTEAFGPLGAERYKVFVDDIHASCSHLLSSVNKLLDMSKIAAGQYPPRKDRKYRPRKEKEASAQIVVSVGRTMRERVAEADALVTPVADGAPVVTASDVTEWKQKKEMLKAQMKELTTASAMAKEHAEHLAQMTDTLTCAIEQAKAESDNMSEFLANVSHDLRTPLNAVLSFSEILKTEAFGPLGAKRYKNYADDIHASGSHLLSLINDLLDMSKIQAGKYRLHKKNVAMSQIVGEVGRMMRGRAVEADLVLQLDSLDAGLTVDVDVRAIKQVLINLLANAITYTPAGGRVRLGVRVEPAHVAIQVADNGIGIPKDELPRLLRPFEQIDRDDRRGRKGTGFDLALSNALVQLHQGSLTLDSILGIGTTATVRLPL